MKSFRFDAMLPNVGAISSQYGPLVSFEQGIAVLDTVFIDSNLTLVNS